MKKNINIHWFRRDLRIEDNAALHAALTAGNVLPIFIFDSNILDDLEDKADKRISFIYQQVKSLKKSIEKSGSSLRVFHGNPTDIFKSLMDEYGIETVYAGRDYEPYATRRDKEISDLLEGHNAALHLVKDHVIYERDEILKSDGKPYIVYTPYMRSWKKKYLQDPGWIYEPEKLLDSLLEMTPVKLPKLESFGFSEVKHPVPEPDLDPEHLRRYDRLRDFPARDASSRVGPHLRFGTVSIRKLVSMAYDINEVFLNQLVWRDFFIQILHHFPHTAEASFREKYDAIPWRNDRDEFARWCEGKTGFPMIDAGMRQLNETGYMHNRVRMITANFLTKLLLIDWRWGEKYFAGKLLDYEMANNVGGWQWSAGSGCDAAPYFRIFNPDTQIKKFDPDMEYIKKWLPEFNTENYPIPVVEYKYARQRALDVYKSALSG